MIEFLAAFIVKSLACVFDTKPTYDCVEDDIDHIMNGLYEVGDEFKL